MTTLLPCPYLPGSVELAPEREAHIAERHPDLLPTYRERISQTLTEPDEVRRSDRIAYARILSRYFEDVMGGKHIVVVVISEVAPSRHWVVTAYLARRLSGGTIKWTRS